MSDWDTPSVPLHLRGLSVHTPAPEPLPPVPTVCDPNADTKSLRVSRGACTACECGSWVPLWVLVIIAFSHFVLEAWCGR